MQKLIQKIREEYVSIVKIVISVLIARLEMTLIGVLMIITYAIFSNKFYNPFQPLMVGIILGMCVHDIMMSIIATIITDKYIVIDDREEE